jgi:hypothetical protein
MKLLDRINIFLVTSGSISLSASTLTAAMIQRSQGGGLLTPYRRIIFGLSISDMIQSFALILGPFLVPKGYMMSSSWGIGTIRTCELQGFLLTYGASATCMYTLFLCVYYFCKIKKNMSDNRFRKRVEGKLHLVIILFNLAVCITALITKTYNPLPGGGSCHFARNPFGCDTSIPGQCRRGRYAPFFAVSYYPVAMPCICIFFALWCLITIVWHVVSQDRLFRTSSQAPVVGIASREEIQLDRVARLLKRETMMQVVLYTSAFLVTYGLPFIVAMYNVTNTPVPGPIKCTTSLFFPLGGFYNILIYTRPQVVAFRRLHEGEYSWAKALWLVIKAGGENPDTVESSTSSLWVCCCCRLLYGGGLFWRDTKEDDMESLPSRLRYPALRSWIQSHHKDEQDELGENPSLAVFSPSHENGQSRKNISVSICNSSRRDGDLFGSSVVMSGHDDKSASDSGNMLDDSPPSS